LPLNIVRKNLRAQSQSIKIQEPLAKAQINPFLTFKPFAASFDVYANWENWYWNVEVKS
jgi:hypothetical protein